MADESMPGATSAESQQGVIEQIAHVREEGQAGDWRTKIPQEVRGEKFWENYKTESDAFKAHAELVKYRGANPRIPGADATPEQQSEFYKRLGWPETPDKYQLKRPDQIPEGLTYNEELEKSFLANAAHKAKLNNQQAQILADWWNTDVAPKMAPPKPDPEAEDAHLRETWGAAYEKNMASVERATRAFLDDDAATVLDRAISYMPMEDKVKVMNVWARMGEHIREDSSMDITHRGSAELDKHALERKKAEIFMNPAYTNRTDPRHKSLVQEMADINKQLYGTAPLPGIMQRPQGT